MTAFRILIFFLFAFSMSRAQNDSLVLKNAKPKTLKKMGKSALKQNDPASAVVLLEAYNKKKKDAEAQVLLGEAYMKTRDYERAQKTFLRAYNMDKEKAPEALYYHAQMMKSNGAYDSARYNFQKFKKEYKGDQKDLKKQATREIAFCDSVQQIILVKPKTMVVHLDTSINKVHVEAAPSNPTSEEMVFTSFRTEKKEYESEDDTSSAIKRKLYKAVRKNGTWQFEGEYGNNLNDDNYHTGNACFSPDRKRIYFTRCRENSSGDMICAIYVSEKNGEDWTEPVKLPKTINEPKHTSTMPAVGIDPAKGNEIIYFISDRKGGRGGMDIWYTIYDKKKKVYKAPKNAGAKINTTRDELSPFMDPETRTLYFSSDGLGGLGGFDIYKARGDGKKWTGAENIGLPLNSGADDIFYTISTNREEGFLVSNRKGGNSIKNNTCCDDIYYYKQLEFIKLILKGKVLDNDHPRLPVKGAIVEVYYTNKSTNERILVKTLTTDDNGNYSTTLEPGQDYFVLVKQREFLGNTVDVSTKNITAMTDIVKDINLTKKPKTPIHIPNVRYQFDRAEIEESSKISLDTTVLRLMQNNPELIIEIMSHTDNKGSDSYNLKLSQKRAESVVKYLHGKGIGMNRLKATGYGESMPIAPNENPDGSDNPDGRAKNRRTDFKIIGELDVELINDN